MTIYGNYEVTQIANNLIQTYIPPILCSNKTSVQLSSLSSRISISKYYHNNTYLLDVISRVLSCIYYSKESQYMALKQKDRLAIDDSGKIFHFANNKYVQEFNRNINILDKHNKITGKAIKRIHRNIFPDINSGYRDRFVYLSQNDVSQPSLIPCPPKYIPLLMNDCCKYINALTNMDTWLKIHIIYVQLLLIHPFTDGNGRLAKSIIFDIVRRYDESKIIYSLILIYNILNFRNITFPAYLALQSGNLEAFVEYVNKSTSWSIQEAAILDRKISNDEYSIDDIILNYIDKVYVSSRIYIV